MYACIHRCINKILFFIHYSHFRSYVISTLPPWWKSIRYLFYHTSFLKLVLPMQNVKNTNTYCFWILESSVIVGKEANYNNKYFSMVTSHTAKNSNLKRWICLIMTNVIINTIVCTVHVCVHGFKCDDIESQNNRRVFVVTMMDKQR